MTEKILKELEEIRKYVMIKHPFLFSTIAKLPVVIENVKTAATDGRKLMFDPKFWNLLMFKEDKVGVFLHEVLHVALRHVEAMRSKTYKGTWNIVTDAIVNDIVKQLGYDLPAPAITFEDLAKMTNHEYTADELRKKSATELYWIMLKYVKKVEAEDLIPRSGDESGVAPSIDIPTVDVFGKMAGNIPGSLIERIEELLKPKVDWKRLLRVAFYRAYRGKGRYSWSKVHRKLPNLRPGRFPKKVMEPRKIYVLIDVSGSVVSEKLVFYQFVSEIAEIAKEFRTELEIVLWDTEIKNIIKSRDPKKIVEEIEKTPRGGGTIIDDAIYYIDDRVEESDAVVILTDGQVSSSPQAQKIMKELPSRVGVAVYCYTLEIMEPIRNSKGWKIIRIMP